VDFPMIIKSALDLGVVPTLALFLVFVITRQNRQLAADKREMEARLLDEKKEMETRLLNLLLETVADSKSTIDRLYERLLAERDSRPESATNTSGGG